MSTGRTETEAEAEGRADEVEGRGTSDPADRETRHLDEMEDGCGCAEVWEHMSERRAED
jgi:hypothetical protein